MRSTDFFLLIRIGIAGIAFSVATTANAQPRSITISCGSASNGLGVEIKTTQPKKHACPLAIKVANTYLRATDKPVPIKIMVNDVTWICRERKGETNPYRECVMQKMPSERVYLVS